MGLIENLIDKIRSRPLDTRVVNPSNSFMDKALIFKKALESKLGGDFVITPSCIQFSGDSASVDVIKAQKDTVYFGDFSVFVWPMTANGADSLTLSMYNTNFGASSTLMKLNTTAVGHYATVPSICFDAMQISFGGSGLYLVMVQFNGFMLKPR